jgi:polysaccharide pyruvyl transferase WcaK-like protein
MNVFITQHTGATNKGAEALLRGTLRLIADCAGGGARVRCVTSQLEYDTRLFPEVQFLPRLHLTPKRQQILCGLAVAPRWLSFPAAWGRRARQFWLLDRAYREADIIISIGGDMFTDHYGLDGLANELWYLEEAVRRRKPVCLLGQSIGPLGPEANRRHALDVLRQMDLITVREQASWRFLREAGLPMDNVRLVGDLSLLMEVDGRRDSRLAVSLKGGAPKVGFNVSHSIASYAGPGSEHRRYIAACAAGIRLLWQRYPEAVVYLVPHVMDRQANDDRLACAELAEQLADPRVVNFDPVMVAAATAMDLKYLISQMDVFVAARTHAALAAYTTGVPVVAIAYSLKAKGLAEHFWGNDWPNYVLDVAKFSGEDLVGALSQTIDRREELRDVLLDKSRELRAAAQENLPLVRQLLARGQA